MRRRWSLVLAVGVLGCEAPEDAPEAVVEDAEVCVSGPAASATQVVSALGVSSLTDGCAPHPRDAGGAMLAMALGPDDVPVGMAWLGEDDVDITPRTTAAVLVGWGVGAHWAPVAYDDTVRSLIGKAQELDAVATAVEEALDGDASVFASDAPAVALAVSDAARALLPRVRAAAGPSYAVAIDPLDRRSGIEVIASDGVNRISFLQHLRRGAFAFVDKVHVVDADGISYDRDEAADRGPIPAVKGLDGAIATLGQVIGSASLPGPLSEQEDVAWVPREVGPVSVPPEEGFARTTYRVAIVGPGASDGDSDQLTAEEQERLRKVSAEFFVSDVFLPFVLRIAVPNSKLDGQLENAAGRALVGDVVELVLREVPQAVELAQSGQFQEAGEFAITTFLTSRTLARGILLLIGEHLVEGAAEDLADASERVTTAARTFANVTRIADTLTTSFDLSSIAASMAQSDRANVWTVDVVPSRVTLEPPNPVLQKNAFVDLIAEVADAEDDTELEYVFRTSGSIGRLESLTSNDVGSEVTTSSPRVIWRNHTGQSGSEAVTVEVFSIELTERASIGTDTVTVDVEDDCDASAYEPVTPTFHLVPAVDPGPGGVYFHMVYSWPAVPGFEDYWMVVDTTQPHPSSFIHVTFYLEGWRGIGFFRNGRFDADSPTSLGATNQPIAAALNMAGLLDDERRYSFLDHVGTVTNSPFVNDYREAVVTIQPHCPGGL